MKGVMVKMVVAMCLFASCMGPADIVATEQARPTPRPTLAPAPTTTPDDDAAGEAPDQEPVAYVPAGQPGTAQNYAGLVDKLEALVVSELRGQVPWPDLRNPNPIVAQVEIFALWTWMAETLTEPQLAEIMAAPGSPSREDVVSIFGDLRARDVFEVRRAQPYQAFDHRVVTFESAGLPLWLGRDVPAQAVVVYYRDNSGPVTILDQSTESVIATQPAVSTRAWLSIMVPTDVGWQLWRDQLIEPNDAELQFPDVPPPPGTSAEPRTPEL